jgi:hypothetical protein
MSPELNRRQFLQQAGITAGVVSGLLDFGGNSIAQAAPADSSITLISDPADPIATSSASQWALSYLKSKLESRGVAVRLDSRPPGAPTAGQCVIAAGMKSSGTSIVSESLALIPSQGGSVVLATGADPRGLAYALTELADRAVNAADPVAALRLTAPIHEQPANRIRGVMRCFVSNIEDKGWYNDRDFWTRYLDMLAGQRFNRFNLALGLGYDSAEGLRDTYFFFAYPFLLNVPGYSVRVDGLPDSERDQNLQMLRFISDETARRGMDFQLGLWTHAFQWINSPNANYLIEGLTPQTQAPYSHDALKMLLEACPSISGITLRVHGESGVPEGSYDFWQSLFAAMSSTGRPLRIDMHAKGMDQKMIDVALASKLPVTLSPKFWAEHMGLPYFPASIREEEMPRQQVGGGLYSLSSGARSFLRYSYGDLLTKDRPYSILHRIWPGTQHLLAWADPTYAAEYGRAFSFCGTDGLELMEPLTFKGRKGSGLPGGRDAYADASLKTSNDWEKYSQTYRLWGRLTYNPDSDPDVWQRSLRHDFGGAAAPLESALANSSRILPLILTSHDPSASNYNYGPEIYSNMSMFDESNPRPYTDTPRPRVFTAVSSLDPQFFATCVECADALLANKPLGKYSPLEVARQLDDWSAAARADLNRAAAQAPDATSPDFRRLSADAAVAAGLGRFFADKFRAGVLFVIFDRTGNELARQESIKAYQHARDAWAELSQGANKIYVSDITFGIDPWTRGNWQARLPAIDRDIAGVAAYKPKPASVKLSDGQIAAAISAALNAPRRPAIAVTHTAASTFVPSAPLNLQINAPAEIISARLWYRRVNQAERFKSVDMDRNGQSFQASIPADYTNSPFALQYYFELRTTSGAVLHPGFRDNFLGQPYFLVRQT